MSEETARLEIRNYIDSEHSGYPNWYVGIASDPQVRLREHGVDPVPTAPWWICRDAGSEAGARRAESWFLNTLGTDGGPGGGDSGTRYVYAYRKTWQTKP